LFHERKGNPDGAREREFTRWKIFFTTKDFLWKYFIFFYLKPNPYAWGSGLSLSSSPARICYRWLEKKALRMAQIGAWLRVNLIRKWDPYWAHRTEAEIVIDPSSKIFNFKLFFKCFGSFWCDDIKNKFKNIKIYIILMYFQAIKSITISFIYDPQSKIIDKE
jgi:hypothetical protein